MFGAPASCAGHGEARGTRPCAPRPPAPPAQPVPGLGSSPAAPGAPTPAPGTSCRAPPCRGPDGCGGSLVAVSRRRGHRGLWGRRRATARPGATGTGAAGNARVGPQPLPGPGGLRREPVPVQLLPRSCACRRLPPLPLTLRQPQLSGAAPPHARPCPAPAPAPAQPQPGPLHLPSARSRHRRAGQGTGKAGGWQGLGRAGRTWPGPGRAWSDRAGAQAGHLQSRQDLLSSRADPQLSTCSAAPPSQSQPSERGPSPDSSSTAATWCPWGRSPSSQKDP